MVGRTRVAADLDTTAGLAWLTGQLIQSRQLDEIERVRAPEALVGHGVHRMVSVPIRGDSRTAFGVLEVGSEEEGGFTRHDLSFPQGIANSVATAVGLHAGRTNRTERAELAVEQQAALAGRLDAPAGRQNPTGISYQQDATAGAGVPGKDERYRFEFERRVEDAEFAGVAGSRDHTGHQGRDHVRTRDQKRRCVHLRKGEREPPFQAQLGQGRIDMAEPFVLGGHQQVGEAKEGLQVQRGSCDWVTLPDDAHEAFLEERAHEDAAHRDRRRNADGQVDLPIVQHGDGVVARRETAHPQGDPRGQFPQPFDQLRQEDEARMLGQAEVERHGGRPGLEHLRELQGTLNVCERGAEPLGKVQGPWRWLQPACSHWR